MRAVKQLLLIHRLKSQQPLTKGRVLGYVAHFFYFFILQHLIMHIWPYLINSLTHNQLYYAAMMSINLVYYGLCALLTYLQYKDYPWLERLKITGKPWPWKQDAQAWNRLFWDSVKTTFVNGFLMTSAIMYLMFLRPLPIDFSLEHWPSTLEFCYQLLIFMLTQDLLFYCSHRLLHRPRLYWIHKRHHQYTQTTILAAQYSHPLQHILSGLIPTAAGQLILGNFTRIHFVTVYLWIMYRSVQGCFGHTGYEFEFEHGKMLPFAVGADHHDFHHAHNCGNYGSLFMFWDAIMGTQGDYVKWLQGRVQAGDRKQE